MDEYYDIADIHTPCTLYQSRPASFWRVMCGNLVKNDGEFDMDSFRLAEISDFSLFMKWQMRMITLDKAIAETYDDDGFQMANHVVSKDRLFFTTEKGYMGWAPKGARKGDVVVLMPGGKVPYVSRSLDVDDEDDCDDERARSGASNSTASAAQTIRPRYRFLSDAYAQGIMNGEAYDESKLAEITLI
jgi:hypothetical protein